MPVTTDITALSTTAASNSPAGTEDRTTADDYMRQIHAFIATLRDRIASPTITGNIAFTGTGNRITGDFSNATIANRVAFQSSTTNSNTAIVAIPNGTATFAGWQCVNNSTTTNASYLQVGANSSSASIVSAYFGSGTYLPLSFFTGGSERVRIDSSGNVGIGTTSAAAKLQVQSGTPPTQPTWSTTDVVIAGNASGSAAYFQAFSDIAGGFVHSTPSDRAKSFLVWNDTVGTATLQNGGAGHFSLVNNGAERLRIDSSGNVGIGTTSPVSRVSFAGDFDAFLAGSKPSLTGLGSYGGGIGLKDGTKVSGIFSADEGKTLVFFLDQGESDTAVSKARMSLGNTGNLTITGTLTESSDERLKSDFSERVVDLESIVSVTPEVFTRDGERGVGVRAQSLQTILPEAVKEDKDGFLSVSYGTAAMVLVLSLAREVAALKAEIAALKAA